MKYNGLVERFEHRNRNRSVLLDLLQHSGCDFLPVEPVMNLCGNLSRSRRRQVMRLLAVHLGTKLTKRPQFSFAYTLIAKSVGGWRF